MARGDVERLEVVPVGLGFRTLGHGEAHADEDVLELGLGLGDEVQVAGSGPGQHLGQVEALGLEAGPSLRLPHLDPAEVEGRLQACARLVELSATAAALLGWQAAEALLQGRQP